MDNYDDRTLDKIAKDAKIKKETLEAPPKKNCNSDVIIRDLIDDIRMNILNQIKKEKEEKREELRIQEAIFLMEELLKELKEYENNRNLNIEQIRRLHYEAFRDVDDKIVYDMYVAVICLLFLVITLNNLGISPYAIKALNNVSRGIIRKTVPIIIDKVINLKVERSQDRVMLKTLLKAINTPTKDVVEILGEEMTKETMKEIVSVIHQKIKIRNEHLKSYPEI